MATASQAQLARSKSRHWSGVPANETLRSSHSFRETPKSKGPRQHHHHGSISRSWSGIQGSGTLRFPGSRQRNSKWVRVQPNASPQTLVEVLSEMWGLQLPSVVISVTGDAANQHDFPERVSLQFKRRLREVSLRTKAWIITGGTKAGVMRIVGDMVRDTEDDIVCVGFATWGVIRHHEKLEQQRASNDPVFFVSGKDSASTKGIVELEPNHSHIVLVDDGSVGQFGKEIALRSAVEDKLCGVHCKRDISFDRLDSQPENNGGGSAVYVQLLVGGGPYSLDTLIATLEKKRPVVVFADTGRSAAVITMAHDYLKKMEPKAKAIDRFEADLPTAEELGLRETQQIEVWEKCARSVARVLRLGAEKAVGGDAELLTFFSLDMDDAEEDKLIEEAVLSGCGDAFERVLLAVKWGAPAILLRHLDGAAGQISEHALSRVFSAALQTGRNDVVQTLINFGELVGCHPRFLRFIDFERLWMVEHDRYELFQHLVVQRDKELQALASNTPRGKRRTLAHAGMSVISSSRLARSSRSRVLPDSPREGTSQESTPRQQPALPQHRSSLLIRMFSILGLPNQGSESNVGQASSKQVTNVAQEALELYIPGYAHYLKARLRGEKLRLQKEGKTSSALDAEPSYLTRLTMRIRDLPCTWTDLLMWAALIGKQDLAQTFWRHTETPLRDALQAARLCRRLGTTKGGADELPLYAAADEYEAWATGVLDCVYSRKHAVRMLCSTTREWPNSPIEEAYAVEGGERPCLDFLAHRQCQYVADMVFCGNHEGSSAAISRSCSMLTILVQALCPFLPGVFVTINAPTLVTKVPDSGATAISRHNSTAFSEDRNEDVESDSSDDMSEPGLYAMDQVDNYAAPFLGIAQSMTQSAPQMLLFYSIPKVKVAVHTAAYIGFIVLLAINVMDMGGADGQFPARLTILELLFYIVSATRFVEEVEQMCLNGLSPYLSSFWNIIDFSIVMLVGVVLVLRVITLPTHDDILSTATLPRKYIIPATCCAGDVAILVQLEQSVRTCMSLICILVGVRLLEIFRIYRNAGVLSIILTKMLWGDVLPFSGLLIVIFFSFGLAFQALMPNVLYDSLPSSPLFIPLWASLGAIDLEHMQEYLNSYDRVNSVLGPALLWIFSFMSTVVLVNLLIAMMADTFQKIEAEGLKQWQFHRIQIILEYKDERESLPPPFNVWILLYRLFLKLGRRLVTGRWRKSGEREKLGIKLRVNSQLAVMLGQQGARYSYLKDQAAERSQSLAYQVESVLKEQRVLRDEQKERDERNEKTLAIVLDKLQRLESLLEPQAYCLSSPPSGSQSSRSCRRILPTSSTSPQSSAKRAHIEMQNERTQLQAALTPHPIQAYVCSAQQAAAQASVSAARMEALLQACQAAQAANVPTHSTPTAVSTQDQRARYPFLSPVVPSVSCTGGRTGHPNVVPPRSASDESSIGGSRPSHRSPPTLLGSSQEPRMNK